MAKTQPRGGINPPGPSDRQLLTDYSSVIQLTFDDLYQAAHDHSVLTKDPGPKDGSIQTVSIVDTGTSVYLVVKTKRGWFKSPTFTAI
jgi:hypothetical protein